MQSHPDPCVRSVSVMAMTDPGRRRILPRPRRGSLGLSRALLSRAIALGLPGVLGLSLAALPGTAVVAGKRVADGSGVVAQTYIVLFDDAPLAAYRGEPEPDPITAAAVDRGAPDRTASGSLTAVKSDSDRSLRRPAALGGDRLDPAAPAARAYRAYLHDRRDQALAVIGQRIGRDTRPDFIYELILNGVALRLSADEAEAIADLPGVRRVVPDWVATVQTDSGPTWIGAPDLWTGVAGVQSRGEGVVVGVIDTGINPDHPAFAATATDPLSSEVFTHSNPRGQMLGLCASTGLPCNTKLIGMFDLTATGNEDDDGRDRDGHGSHVASTAVGNPIVASFSSGSRAIAGVAPRANLISFKACEGVSNCRGSWLQAALEQAVAVGVDVLNYSIGGPALDPFFALEAEAMLNLRAAGVLAVVAAGNRGPEPRTLTSPANAPWVLSVAAASHTRLVGNRLSLSGGDSSPPGDGELFGASAIGASGAGIDQDLLFDRDPQHPLCSTGPGDGLAPGSIDEPDGSSNPWPTEPNRFSGGRIVVCERGSHARIAKSD
ncbi:MAG TPA: hypothetical protein DDZ76_00285, partial [Xanthomonadales bacterium]|nr:hypothetical protein [Xanthomonadales bacterium]